MARVLIIDDDQMICRLLLDMVTKLGHHGACENSRDAGMKEALSTPMMLSSWTCKCRMGAALTSCQELGGLDLHRK